MKCTGVHLFVRGPQTWTTHLASFRRNGMKCQLVLNACIKPSEVTRYLSSIDGSGVCWFPCLYGCNLHWLIFHYLLSLMRNTSYTNNEDSNSYRGTSRLHFGRWLHTKVWIKQVKKYKACLCRFIISPILHHRSVKFLDLRPSNGRNCDWKVSQNVPIFLI